LGGAFVRVTSKQSDFESVRLAYNLHLTRVCGVVWLFGNVRPKTRIC